MKTFSPAMLMDILLKKRLIFTMNLSDMNTEMIHLTPEVSVTILG